MRDRGLKREGKGTKTREPQYEYAGLLAPVPTDFNFGYVPVTCPPTIAIANDGGVLTVLSLGIFPASTVTASIIGLTPVTAQQRDAPLDAATPDRWRSTQTNGDVSVLEDRAGPTIHRCESCKIEIATELDAW